MDAVRATRERANQPRPCPGPARLARPRRPVFPGGAPSCLLESSPPKHPPCLASQFRDDRREAYVRVVLQQHHGQVKVKRTSTVRCQDDNINFSECFNFHVPAASIDVSSLALQLEQPNTRYGRGREFQPPDVVFLKMIQIVCPVIIMVLFYVFFSDKLIGKCVLGSYMFARGKALTHWNTSFGNPMQQVQQWHALSI